MPAGKGKIFKGLRFSFVEHAMKGELELRDNKLMNGTKNVKNKMIKTIYNR